MPTGKVKFYDISKSYGFITPDEAIEDGKDIFVHLKELQQSGMSFLSEHQKVSSDLKEVKEIMMACNIMTRSGLIKKVADWSFELTQSQAEQLVSIMLDEIIRAVDSGERVELRGFGSFFPRQRQSRMARNPKTGEPVSVAAKRVLFFKAGKNLLQRLNSKKAGKAVKK